MILYAHFLGEWSYRHRSRTLSLIRPFLLFFRSIFFEIFRTILPEFSNYRSHSRTPHLRVSGHIGTELSGLEPVVLTGFLVLVATQIRHKDFFHILVLTLYWEMGVFQQSFRGGQPQATTSLPSSCIHRQYLQLLKIAELL